MTPGLTLTGRVELSGQKLARADVREWLARAAVWFETVGDAVLDAQLDRDGDRPVVLVTFHPTADDVEVRLTSSGTVRVAARTSPAGPGYHAYLCGTLDAFAEDFDIAWDQVEDPTGFSRTADLGALNSHFLASLRRTCRELTASMNGAPAALGLPADHGFTHPGPVLTPTGPRSRQWLTDPAAARDFFPWWAPEPDAAFYRNRALALLWCEFPWRPPLTEDEGELTDQIAADLEMAHSLDPAGPLPWAEWAEVLAAIAGDQLGLTVQGIEPALKAGSDPTGRRIKLHDAYRLPALPGAGGGRRRVVGGGAGIVRRRLGRRRPHLGRVGRASTTDGPRRRRGGVVRPGVRRSSRRGGPAGVAAGRGGAGERVRTAGLSHRRGRPRRPRLGRDRLAISPTHANPGEQFGGLICSCRSGRVFEARRGVTREDVGPRRLDPTYKNLGGRSL